MALLVFGKDLGERREVVSMEPGLACYDGATDEADLALKPFNPHYARDAIARSCRWPCHRATAGART